VTDLAFLAFLIVDGALAGAIYALVGLTFVVVYKSSHVAHFAIGEFITLAARMVSAGLNSLGLGRGERLQPGGRLPGPADRALRAALRPVRPPRRRADLIDAPESLASTFRALPQGRVRSRRRRGPPHIPPPPPTCCAASGSSVIPLGALVPRSFGRGPVVVHAVSSTAAPTVPTMRIHIGPLPRIAAGSSTPAPRRLFAGFGRDAPDATALGAPLGFTLHARGWYAPGRRARGGQQGRDGHEDSHRHGHSPPLRTGRTRIEWYLTHDS
jgi:hypothetical protein